jgi:hypothetical protein
MDGWMDGWCDDDAQNAIKKIKQDKNTLSKLPARNCCVEKSLVVVGVVVVVADVNGGGKKG